MKIKIQMLVLVLGTLFALQATPSFAQQSVIVIQPQQPAPAPVVVAPVVVQAVPVMVPVRINPDRDCDIYINGSFVGTGEYLEPVVLSLQQGVSVHVRVVATGYSADRYVPWEQTIFVHGAMELNPKMRYSRYRNR